MPGFSIGFGVGDPDGIPVNPFDIKMVFNYRLTKLGPIDPTGSEFLPYILDCQLPEFFI